MVAHMFKLKPPLLWDCAACRALCKALLAALALPKTAQSARAAVLADTRKTPASIVDMSSRIPFLFMIILSAHCAVGERRRRVDDGPNGQSVTPGNPRWVAMGLSIAEQQQQCNQITSKAIGERRS